MKVLGNCIIVLACAGLAACTSTAPTLATGAPASVVPTSSVTRGPAILLPTRQSPADAVAAPLAEPSDTPPATDRVPASAGIESENGRRVATLYNLVDSDVFVLEVFDRQTDETVIVYQGESTKFSGLYGFGLSPDGEWIAFIVAGVLPGHGFVPGAKMADLSLRPTSGSGYTFGKVMVAPVADPEQVREIGFCGLDEFSLEKNVGASNACTSWIAWAPDSRALVWGDIRALWYAELGHGAVPLSHDNLRPRSWSPLGRYLMVDEGGESRDIGVVDTYTGRWIAFRDTFPYPEAGDLDVDWAGDGRLVLERTVNGAARKEYWRIDPAVDGWLVLDATE